MSSRMVKTPKSESKKVNTLFSYFNKTPTGKDSKETLTGNSQTPGGKKSNSSLPELKFSAGGLLWAKLEGHPWWPSLVYNHPKEEKVWRSEGKQTLIHVQFFGSPPTRGWVKERFLKPFNGSSAKECQRGGTLFSSSAKWRDAVAEADKALEMGIDERLLLAVASELSDDAESGGEEDAVEISEDEKIETSLDGSDKVEKENVTPPSASSTRTPKSSRKSAKKPETKRRRVIESDDDDDVADASMEDSFHLEEGEGLSSSEEEESDDHSGEEGEGDEIISGDDDDQDCKPVVKGIKRKRNGKAVSRAKPSTPLGVSRPSVGKTTTKKVKATPKALSKFGRGNSAPEEEEKEEEGGSARKSEVLNKSSVEVSFATKTKLSAFSAGCSNKEQPSPAAEEARTFPHTSFKFLQPDKIRDASRRLASDPDYDPKTLYVPEDFLIKQTPAMKQWWILKCQYYDTLLFFKMGKFYELFHMDAITAVNELGLLFMKGDHAHCGFPEVSYGRFSDMLVQKGYKVARIEQTETPEQMQERTKQAKSSTKFDKVVRREVCSVQSRGTKRSSFIDGDCSSSDHNFLLAISEKAVGSESVYGVCFIDVMIGTFYLGQFDDDRHGSRLRTLVSHYTPVQVLYEKGKLSEKTKNMFNGCMGHAIKEGLRSGSEFWDGSKTLKFLSESEYFIDEENTDNGVQWPEVFKELVSKDDSLGLTPSDDFTLALSSLGAVVWYLRHCLMDDELLSMKSFQIYKPVDTGLEDQASQSQNSSDFSGNTNKRMILDGVTLVNLDVLVNSSTGSLDGTLLQVLDHCKTAFGKRLFKQWLCSPLCNISSIDDRLNAVEDLISIPDVSSQVSNLLSSLPDLERLLNKIHTLGSSKRNKDHPDSRAVFFEDVLYNKRKIEDFISCLQGFKTSMKIISLLGDLSESFKSVLLKQCTNLQENSGKFPNLTKILDFFDSAFDHQAARSAGVVKPTKGVNRDYDKAVADIKSTENELNDCLEDLKTSLRCKTLVFFGTAKNRYQVEVPESLGNKVSDEFELTSRRKGFNRYQNDTIKGLFAKLTDAEDRRDAAQRDTMRCIFDQFDKHNSMWTQAIQCLSVLDVLTSLVTYSNQSGMCRPEVVPCQSEAFIEIRSGRHPCLDRSYMGGDFIPNDILIGTSDDSVSSARVLLVTGPNMGGKSTLMRQVGLICLMAQLGCYVPAEKCKLTPVDRIFTRLGASDHIMSGESTFFVELSETSCVLQHATQHSLVLLDELGRGTATYDGNAIASAVLEELTNEVKCRTIFSTHYHSIVDRFSKHPCVSLGHMACMVENEDDDDPCQETITFLYKLASGNCPKSYGFNAAKLAGIPLEVVKMAYKKAKEFEESVKVIKLFRSIWTAEENGAEMLMSLLGQI